LRLQWLWKGWEWRWVEVGGVGMVVEKGGGGREVAAVVIISGGGER
jgi:hypothetical protein